MDTSVQLTTGEWFIQWAFEIVISSVAIFLILLILVQRGRGGGLAGALGGMGGHSALGTKAGDLFTRITAWTALVWIVACALAIVVIAPKSPTKPPIAADGRAAPDLGGFDSVSDEKQDADTSDETDTEKKSSKESNKASLNSATGNAESANQDGATDKKSLNDDATKSASEDQPSAKVEVKDEAPKDNNSETTQDKSDESANQKPAE